MEVAFEPGKERLSSQGERRRLSAAARRDICLSHGPPMDYAVSASL